MLQLGERIAEQKGGALTGQVVRARLQSAQLKSDMQAFKAANPRCDLEDLVVNPNPNPNPNLNPNPNPNPSPSPNPNQVRPRGLCPLALPPRLAARGATVTAGAAERAHARAWQPMGTALGRDAAGGGGAAAAALRRSSRGRDRASPARGPAAAAAPAAGAHVIRVRARVVHSRTQSPTQPLTHSLTHSPTHLPTAPLPAARGVCLRALPLAAA